MRLENRLWEISDDVLLERLDALVRRQNALTAALLSHIAEVDRRRLYLREACSSMHRYCVERLGLSDGAAYKRIHAARAVRRFPVLLTMVERGELHLKGITLLAPHLTEANHRDVLQRARHQPVRAVERLVAELAPRPDVSPRLRALSWGQTEPAPRPAAPATPAPSATPAQSADRLSRADPAALEGWGAAPTTPRDEPAPAPVPTRPARKAITPLAPRRYELRITIDEATHADLAQLQDLFSHQLPHRDPDVIVSRALALLLDRTLALKAGVINKPRAAPNAEGTAASKTAPEATVTAEPHNVGECAKRSRHIPSDIRRTVWSRDGGRCAFRDSRARRCTATSQLEFHHIDNFGGAPITSRPASNFDAALIICTRQSSTTARPSSRPHKPAEPARVSLRERTSSAVTVPACLAQTSTINETWGSSLGLILVLLEDEVLDFQPPRPALLQPNGMAALKRKVLDRPSTRRRPSRFPYP